MTSGLKPPALIVRHFQLPVRSLSEKATSGLASSAPSCLTSVGSPAFASSSAALRVSPYLSSRALSAAVISFCTSPSARTEVVGSVADRQLVLRTVSENGIEAIVHGGALHKPNIEHHENADFVATNVEGTLNLLDAAAAHGVQRFIFTSTTSLMISQT